MGMIGLPELVVIGLIAALIFGPRQLPKLGRAFGETLKELKGVGAELRGAGTDLEREVAEVQRAAAEVVSERVAP